MKVVLFCGGLGMRMREHSETIPKPMATIGYRPILWHLMKYYAHYGHKDFILCLGWQGNVIKDYFLNYNECASNDFTLRDGGHIDLTNTDIHDWNITFVDTGVTANIGQRLKAVEHYLEGEEIFLANYSDGLSDLELPLMIDDALAADKVVTCLCVRPKQSFHLVETDEAGAATDTTPIAVSPLWMNGGYFVLKREIFQHLGPGEDLWGPPVQRLIQQRQVHTYRYDGFWGCMDTHKERALLEEMYHNDQATWQVWKGSEPVPSRSTAREQANGHGRVAASL